MTSAEIKPAPGHGTKCPRCGVGQLVTRMVSKGEKVGTVFLGCNNWRTDDDTSCRHTIWPEAASPAASKKPRTQSNKGGKCPKCQTGSLRERLIKNGENAGKTFHSCDNWHSRDDISCDYKEWPKVPAPAYKYKPKPAPRYRPPRPKFLRNIAMTDSKPESQDDTLLAYSKGLLSRQEAISRLGLRDSADVLVALGDAGLKMPMPSEQEN